MDRRSLNAAVGFTLVIQACCYTPATRVRGRALPVESGTEPMVRVRISAVTRTARVTSAEGLQIRLDGTRRQLGVGSEVVVKATGGSLAVVVEGRSWPATAETLMCRSPGGLLAVDGRRYRGGVRAFVSGGELVVVNDLPVEEYLLGVVPCEIPTWREATVEATKAQAVAARSFTLARIGQRRGLGYELYDTFRRDQEYRGVDVETEQGRRAVGATRGEVLEHAGVVTEALFHANCGGVTANGSQPYLRSVRDAPKHGRGRPFCAWSANFTWEVELARDEFESRLAGLPGLSGGARVQRIEVERSGPRAASILLRTAQGERRMTGADFRLGLGLKSTLFDVELTPERVRFRGRGWGHGSGLCQDGALEMARRGLSYRQILLHYYSGVRLRRRY